MTKNNENISILSKISKIGIINDNLQISNKLYRDKDKHWVNIG